MKKKSDQFDDFIREKLERLQLPYNPTNWDVLAQQLEPEESGTPLVEDQLFDEVIFTKLHNASAERGVAQWERLAARLDEENDARRKVLAYKLMEVALVLLLFMFVGQYVTNFEAGSTKIAATHHNSDGANFITNKDCIEICYENLAVAAAKAKRDIDKAKTLEKGGQKSRQSSVQNLYTSLGSDLPTFEYEVHKYHRVSPSLPTKPLQQQHSKHTGSAPLLDLNDTPDFLNLVAPKPWDLINVLDGILLSELEHNKNIEADYTMLIKPVRKRPTLIVSMFGSGDYNHIITPSKVENEDIFEEVRRYAPGYGGGIMAGLVSERWEVSSGAIYTSKIYQPRLVLYAKGNLRDGYFLEGIKDIQLNTLNIPLQVRYDLVQHDKWRVYATAGFSFQVAFQADYYIADQDAFKDILSAQNLPPAPQNPPSFGNDPLNGKKLPKGFLEGGSLWENSYVTGNVGFGLERYMTGRWSIFAQPTYHHSLEYFTKGLGPDKDRIHTMSFFTGVRVRLNP